MGGSQKGVGVGNTPGVASPCSAREVQISGSRFGDFRDQEIFLF